jgi:Spy/CpxP family protein refolding chaperone
MRFNRTLGPLLVATTAIATAAVATAATSPATNGTNEATAPAPTGKQHPRHHGGMLIGMTLRATRELNLTPEQQQTIKGIISNARTQHKAELASQPALDITVLGNPGDPNYATAVQSAKTRLAERLQKEMELQSQIYNVLTKQQKDQLPKVLADMKAKGEQRRAAWRQAHPNLESEAGAN